MSERTDGATCRPPVAAEPAATVPPEPAPPPAQPDLWKLRLATAIAVCADAAQLALFPLFAEGLASPLADALDVAVAAAMIWLLGFHFVFIPTAMLEVVPMMDLAPTWTLAVAYVRTRKSLPAEPSPPETR